MEISITVYLGRFSDTVKSYKVEEVPSFVQSIVSTFKKKHGCKIIAAQIKALISLTSSRVLRTAGKVWDQLSMGDRLWVVTNAEWDNYQNNYLQAEALMRNGKVLVIRHPSFLNYEKLLHFIAQYHSDVIPNYPRKSLSSPDSKARQSANSTPKANQSNNAGTPNMLSPDVTTLKIVKKALIRSPASNAKIPLDRTLRLGDLLVSQQNPRSSTAPTVLGVSDELTKTFNIQSPATPAIEVATAMNKSPTSENIPHIAEKDSSFSEGQERSYWSRQEVSMDATVDSSINPSQSLKDTLQSYSLDREDMSTDHEIVDIIGDHSTIEGAISVDESRRGHFEQDIVTYNPTIHEVQHNSDINERFLPNEFPQNLINGRSEYEQQISNDVQEPFSDPESVNEPDSEPNSEPNSDPESDPEPDDSPFDNEDSLPPPDDLQYTDISTSIIEKDNFPNTMQDENDDDEENSNSEIASHNNENYVIEMRNSSSEMIEEENIETYTDSSNENYNGAIVESAVLPEESEKVFDPTKECEDVLNPAMHASDTIDRNFNISTDEHLIVDVDTTLLNYMVGQEQELHETLQEAVIPDHATTLSEQIIDNKILDTSKEQAIVLYESRKAPDIADREEPNRSDASVDSSVDILPINLKEEEQQGAIDSTEADSVNANNIVANIVNDDCSISSDSNITTAQSLYEEALDAEDHEHDLKEDNDLSTDSHFANLVDHVLANTPYQPVELAIQVQRNMGDGIIHQEYDECAMANNEFAATVSHQLPHTLKEVAVTINGSTGRILDNTLPILEEAIVSELAAENDFSIDQHADETDDQRVIDETTIHQEVEATPNIENVDVEAMPDEFPTHMKVETKITDNGLDASSSQSLSVDYNDADAKVLLPSLFTLGEDSHETLLASGRSIDMEEVLKQKNKELEEANRAKQDLEARLEETRYLLQLIASGARAAPYASKRESRDLEDPLRFINLVDHSEPAAVVSSTLLSTVNSPFVVKGSASPAMNRKSQALSSGMMMKSVDAEERRSKSADIDDAPDLKKRAIRVFPAESFDAMDNLDTKMSNAIAVSFADDNLATVIDTIDGISNSQDHMADDDGRYLTDSFADIERRYDSPIMQNSPDNIYDDDLGSSGSRSSLSRPVGASKSTSFIKRIASMRSHRMLMNQNLAKTETPIMSRRNRSFHLHESNKKNGRSSPKLIAVASTQATMPLRKPKPVVPSRVHYKINTKRSQGLRRSESPHQDNRHYHRHHGQDLIASEDYDMDGEDTHEEHANPRPRPELDIDVDDSASDCSSIFPYDMTPKVRRAYRSVDNTPASLLQQQKQQQQSHHHRNRHHQHDQHDLERLSSLEETFRATVQSLVMVDDVNNISHPTPQQEQGSRGIAMGFPDDASLSVAPMDSGISLATSVRDIMDEGGSSRDTKAVNRNSTEQESSDGNDYDKSHSNNDLNQQPVNNENFEHSTEETLGKATSTLPIERFQSLEYSQSFLDIKINDNCVTKELVTECQDDSPRSVDSSVALTQQFDAVIESNDNPESNLNIIEDEHEHRKKEEFETNINGEDVIGEEEVDEDDIPPPPALPSPSFSPPLSISREQQHDSSVAYMLQIDASEPVADTFSSSSKHFTSAPHRSATPSRGNPSLQTSESSGKTHQNNNNNHLSLSALALASNSSLDLLNAATEAANETDAILQLPALQQHPLPSSLSRRPSNVSQSAELPPTGNYNSPDKQSQQPHYPNSHPPPAHFLFPSMLHIPSNSQGFVHQTIDDSRASAISPLSFNNESQVDSNVSRNSRQDNYNDMDAMLNGVIPTTTVTDTSMDIGLNVESRMQGQEKGSLQPKKALRRSQDQPLPAIADSLPLVLTFPKSDTLGHLKRYYYPFLVTYKYSMSPQLKGIRHRLELLQSISDHDLLAWIVFQMFGGSADSIIVTRIKTTQITRALSAAKLSKLSSSQLDLLLVKIKTALAKEGHAAMALAGLAPNDNTTINGIAASSTGTQLRTKTGSILKKKVGASSGNTQSSSGSSDATFPLFLQLLRQLPRQPSTATDNEHLQLISQAFVNMLVNLPDIAMYHRHTIEAAFSLSGVFLRSAYAIISPQLVSPCPLINQALVLLKKMAMPAFALEDVDGVRIIWDRNSEQLHQIYTFYATALETRRISLPGASAMKLQLSLDNLRELLIDFHVLPQLVDIQSFYRLYRATKLWEWEIAECILRSAKVYLLQPSLQNQYSHQQALSPHSNGRYNSSFVVEAQGVNSLLGIDSSFSLLQMLRSDAIGGHVDDEQQQELMFVDLEQVPPLTSLNASIADPADMIGSVGHLSLSYPGFLELLARIAALNVSRLTFRRPHQQQSASMLPLTETVENMLHLMDASEAKAKKLSRASRRSVSVRHFVYANTR